MRIRWVWFAVVTMIAMAGIPGVRAAEPALRGMWLSPDWVLPEDAPAGTEAQARTSVGQSLDRVAALGVNTVFLESYLRGYSIAPCEEGSTGPMPVYGPARFAGKDLLQITIEEAARRDIAVHAWVHCFYWKTDNPQLMRPHHVSTSIWDDLVLSYLNQGLAVLDGADRTLVEKAIAIVQGGNDDLALARLIKESGRSTNLGTLNTFSHLIQEKGGPAPDFLVHTATGDLHLPANKDTWMTLYLDPTNPVVTQRLVDVFARLTRTHPGLAGLHLDHIRYPNGPLNMPADLGSVKPGAFPGGLGGKLYKQFRKVLREREGTITDFVKRCRDVVPQGMTLSAAVHPLYYFERDDWAATITHSDFIGQDWWSWDIDLAVPMIYDSDASRVNRILKKYRFGLSEAGSTKTRLVSGTNLFQICQRSADKKGLSSWVYFDFDGFRQIRSGAVPRREKGGDTWGNMD